jgi:hypothetical protein
MDWLCRNHTLNIVRAFYEHNPVWMLKESRYVRLANTMYRVKKFKNTVDSSQKEQPCLYNLTASSTTSNKTV